MKLMRFAMATVSVFLLLQGERAVAADIDPAAAAACGPGYSPILLCGGDEVLCLPDGGGCATSCVSCCPPCGPDCGPDPSSPECRGTRCVCSDPECGCFTATVDRSKMAPVLGFGASAILLASLFGMGLFVVRKRRAAELS